MWEITNTTQPGDELATGEGGETSVLDAESGEVVATNTWTTGLCE